MKTIEMDIQCQSCRGTGVYVGIAERKGAAVVCYKCNGTGKYRYRFDYEEFEGRKQREGVKRVYKKSYGFVIAPEVINFDQSEGIDLSKEGVSYDDFLEGKMPDHIKKLACPMLADQGACHDIKGFVDECDKLHGGSLLGTFLTRCNYQTGKMKCWERFEKSARQPAR